VTGPRQDGGRVPALPYLPVLVDAPDGLLAKARWVLATLLAAAGARPRFVEDPETGGVPALAYAPRPVEGVPTVPLSSEAVALIGDRRPLPPDSFRRLTVDGREMAAAFPVEDEEFVIPFDLVTSAFVQLACWDELTRPERDRHGRFPFSASLFADNAALRIDEPACDAYAAWLRDLLDERAPALGLPAPAPAEPFRVALTHDVDGLQRWTARGWLAWSRRLAVAAGHRQWRLARFEAGGAAYHVRHDLAAGRDPAFTFPDLLADEDEAGVASTFFIIASHQHRTDGNQPGVYRRRLPELLSLLREAGREVGLHGNHRDSIDGEALRSDRATLAGAAATEVDGIRYHYLKCLYHISLPLVEQAGLTYDSSLAFAEHEGFRCGFSHPFHPYDMERDRPLRIVELPLAVMDTTLQQRHYRHLGAAEARAATEAVLDRVRASGGTAAILWHHNRFHPYAGRGYGEAYWQVVEWVREHGGECLPAGAAVSRWQARVDAAEPGPVGESASSRKATPVAGGVAAPTRSRVAHVSVVHRPDDPRIFERECRTLADAGYDVTYLAPGAGAGFVDGVHLVDLPRRSRSRRWLTSGPLLEHLHRLQPDVVHVHDPELLTLFPMLRSLVGDLVYDMHEYVGQSVAGKYYIPSRLRPAAARATVAGQRALVSLADGVVAVVDEQFDQLGARPDLRITLPNYPRLSRFRDPTPLADMVAEERLKLIYVGSLTRQRGVALMLDVLEQVPEAVLYLGGSFPNPEFEREVEARAGGPLSGRLHLLGRIPPADVPDRLAGADVVWVPAQPTSQYNRPTVATKLYEGMSVGLAVLVSDLPGRGDVVRSEECGLAVEPTVAGHLEGVRRLLADRAATRQMGERGRAAVAARYCWEAVEHRLVDFYAELLTRHRDTRRLPETPPTS